MTDSTQKIILGVDTHKDFHHAAVITALGEAIADERFETTTTGYKALIIWAKSHGQILRAGAEGTGSYGAGLCRQLRAAGIEVIDVMAPDKQERRLRGKTDQADAYSAARAVLSQRATTIPKTRDGEVEAIRVLMTTRQGLVKQATITINQLQSLLVSAPDDLRAKLVAVKGKKLATSCSRLRAGSNDDVVTAATKSALRTLAGHWLDLDATVTGLEKQLRETVTAYAPELMAVYGVGPIVAATLLTVAGQNPDRLTSEAALAHLVGTAPIPASSGKTTKFRLNRGGNRHGNAAFHRIVLVRMKSHPATRAYVEKTTAKGKSKRDVIRLLKRYLAREIFPILIAIQKRHQNTQIAA